MEVDLLAWFIACSGPDTKPPTDGDADTDVDTDSDVDADTDTDVDSADSAGGGTGGTGATGDSGPPPDPRVGRVYVLDLAAGVWTEPVGVGALFASQVADSELLVSPTALDGSGIEWLAAAGAGSAQHLCRPTAGLTQAPWYDPDFAAEGGGVGLGTADVPLVLMAITLAGSFTPSGAALDQVTVSGPLDTRPLSEPLGLGTQDDAVCQLLSTFGIVCDPCPDGSGDYCTRVTIEQLTGPEVVGGTLIPRTQADIDADPACP